MLHPTQRLLLYLSPCLLTNVLHAAPAASSRHFLYPCRRYRITEGINLPFRVLPLVKELGRTRFEVNVKVGACALASWLPSWHACRLL